jgi:hypothetical protein
MLSSKHGLDRCDTDRLIARSQQEKLHRIDSVFTVLGSQLQDLQVLLTALRSAEVLLKKVEGHAEPAGGEQLVTVPVVLEGTRFAHEPVDDVPLVHAMLDGLPVFRRSPAADLLDSPTEKRRDIARPLSDSNNLDNIVAEPIDNQVRLDRPKNNR